MSLEKPKGDGNDPVDVVQAWIDAGNELPGGKYVVHTSKGERLSGELHGDEHVVIWDEDRVAFVGTPAAPHPLQQEHLAAKGKKARDDAAAALEEAGIPPAGDPVEITIAAPDNVAPAVPDAKPQRDRLRIERPVVTVNEEAAEGEDTILLVEPWEMAKLELDAQREPIVTLGHDRGNVIGHVKGCKTRRGVLHLTATVDPDTDLPAKNIDGCDLAPSLRIDRKREDAGFFYVALVAKG